MQPEITEPPSFPLFQHLSPELRSLIWYLALPDASQDKPAIFFHDDKFMRPWKAPEGHKAYTPDGINWYARYFYEEMDPVPVAMSVANVNREARRIACTYARELGYMLLQADKGRPVFSRGMDPGKDILYFEGGALIAMLEKHFADLVTLGQVHWQYHLNPTQYGVCASDANHLEHLFTEPGDVDAAFVFLPEEGKAWQKASPHVGGVQPVRFEADVQGRAWTLNNNTREWSWSAGEELADAELQAEIEACVPDIIGMRWYSPESVQFAPEFYIQPARIKVVQT